MLPDPVTVDADSPNAAFSFAMIKQDGYGSERREAGGAYGVITNHTTGKSGDRHYVKLTKTVNATNPFSGLVSPQSASVSVSIAKPAFGFTDADLANLYKAMVDYFASDDVGVDRIIAFES
jgi:hypothetical protein